MNDLARLIEKHRVKGLLLDTNLLVVLLVGRTNRRRILECKRTQTYTVKEYDLLERFVALFPKAVTTPHLLTEVSNLDPLRGKERTVYQSFYKQWVKRSDELFHESGNLVAEVSFDRFGLADTAIEWAARRGMLVLTDDLNLYLMLREHGIDAVNFNHIRTHVW